MGKRILVSLGGNALGTQFDDLVESVGVIAKPIAGLIKDGHEVVVCHGNGPQVGYIKTSLDKGNASDGIIDFRKTLPLADCVAMSQSYIGYHLQNAIENQLHALGIEKEVATVVTRVEVDPQDPLFKNPTKPIGAFFTKEESQVLVDAGKTVIEDSGRGYREVVASPIPQDILEKETIHAMMNSGAVVIAGGGGGIPVYTENGWTKKIDAVIDKDRVSVMLAAMVEADSLVILTGVEKVAVNFNTPEQKDLDTMTLAECEQYIKEGQFPAGSMLPKIESAMQFVRSGAGRSTLITSLDKLVEGLRGETGTLVVE
ncbi:MAG: carbamate kinase [Eubacteriales bacterium]|nr:carbamate kinase [Eubacteriales bacterium]